MKMLRFLIACAALAVQCAAAESASLTAKEIDFFETRIRPVLASRCYSCHSQSADKVKGGLLLDSRDGVQRGGDSGAIIVPGNPEESRLVQAVRYADASLEMPPKEMLPAQEVADLEEWVRMGAPDPRTGMTATPPQENHKDHWSFQPIGHPTPPNVQNESWIQQPLDRFILAKLEEASLNPAKPAAPEVLLRRLAYQLTGLPPSAEALNEFRSQPSSSKLAELVDQLLESPEFGVRWGRHWLDVARYADSTGLEPNRQYPNAWRYRDYVIQSLNEDKPFDQFIIEQLAGDLLEANAETDERRYELLIATGFLMVGPKALSEPDAQKLRYDVVDEQLDTIGRGFLALTVSCARCHDHKYDPIAARDYYAMAGILASSTSLESDGQRGPFRDWLERPIAPREVSERVEKHAAQLAEVRQALDAVRERKMRLPGDVDSTQLKGVIVDNESATLEGAWKPSIYAEKFVDKNYVHDADSNKGELTATFRFESLQPGKYEAFIAYSPFYNRATNVPVTISASGKTHTVKVDQKAEPALDQVFGSVGVYEFSGGTNEFIRISNEGTEGFVIVDAVRLVPAQDKAAPSMMMMAEQAPAPPEEPDIVMTPDELIAMEDKFLDLRNNAPPPVPSAMAVHDGPPQDLRVHIRGDYSKPGDLVERGFLPLFDAAPLPEQPIKSGHSGRLQLARWITHPEHPLTTRVYVNRVWSQLFGRGIVESVDNFGVLGNEPTHPMLLDYLARRFVELGWSTKALVRELVLSSAYQMSPSPDPSALENDPENKLFSRQNPQRLEAESIRDAMLMVSGLLDWSKGGSPFGEETPQAIQIAALNARAQSESDRRSVYLPVIRNDLPDVFEVFDFPNANSVAGKRHTTTSPTQALYLMNSPFVIRCSEAWAKELTRVNEPAERLRRAYQTAFARSPDENEIRDALEYLDVYERTLIISHPDPNQRSTAAWQSFCQAMFLATEFRYLQ